MLVYEKLGEGGSGNIDTIQQTPDIPKDITDKLQKLGFQMDSATFSRIQRANQSDTFAQDLSAAIINPAEKGRIEQLYLKGFGQVVTLKNGKSMSFYEISRLSGAEKDDILDNQIKASQRERFDEWELLAANQRVEMKKGVEQAVNQEEKKIDANIQAAIESAKTFEKKLQSSTDTLRSLSSLPPDIEQKALAEATKNPPKELAGVPPEEYSAYKNLILANYTISHAGEIGKSLSMSDRDAFSKSIKEMGNILDRTPGDWPRIVETSGGLVLGENREKIRELGDRYIRDGYNQSVVWDSQSRSLIFRGADGEKIIDTATIPPRERISIKGLSISREMRPISEREKKKNTLQNAEKTIISRITQDAKDIHLVDASDDAIPKGLIAHPLISKHRGLQERYKNAANPVEKVLAIKELKENNLKLELARRDSLNIDTTNLELMRHNAMEDQLYQEFTDLSKIERDIAAFIDTHKELTQYNDIKTNDSFDSNARENLNWLTSEDTLFQRMGPDANRAVYRIIDVINRYRDNGNKVSLSNKVLSIADKEKLKESYQKLGGDMSTLRNGEEIRSFQQKISIAVEKPVGAPGSIEALLSDTKSKTPQEQAQNILSPER